MNLKIKMVANNLVLFEKTSKENVHNQVRKIPASLQVP